MNVVIIRGVNGWWFAYVGGECIGAPSRDALVFELSAQ
jgi:hypothetical protein